MKRNISILLILLALIPQVRGVDVEPYTMHHELNTYIDTRIVVSYTFTQNVTTDCNSAGNSVWQAEIGPLSTTFVTSAADKFNWHLAVEYETVVFQTVSIAIFSGDEPVDYMDFEILTDRFSMVFEITVTKQPEYPTAEELADMSIEVLENKLAEYVAEMREQNRLSREHDYAQWAVVGVAFCGFIIMVIPKFRQKGPQSKED